MFFAKESIHFEFSKVVEKDTHFQQIAIAVNSQCFQNEIQMMINKIMDPDKLNGKMRKLTDRNKKCFPVAGFKKTCQLTKAKTGQIGEAEASTSLLKQPIANPFPPSTMQNWL